MMGTAALGDAEQLRGEQRGRLATSLEYWEWRLHELRPSASTLGMNSFQRNSVRSSRMRSLVWFMLNLNATVGHAQVRVWLTVTIPSHGQSLTKYVTAFSVTVSIPSCWFCGHFSTTRFTAVPRQKAYLDALWYNRVKIDIIDATEIKYKAGKRTVLMFVSDEPSPITLKNPHILGDHRFSLWQSTRSEKWISYRPTAPTHQNLNYLCYFSSLLIWLPQIAKRYRNFTELYWIVWVYSLQDPHEL